MELEQILSELEKNTGELPCLALQRAVEEREAITPLLLAALEEYKNKQEELLDKSDYILHIYALYLLAQFREKSAYPLIVEFFSAPGDISLDVKGRFEELQKEIMIGIEASKRGEVVDADMVFNQLQVKLNNLREQAGE